MDLERFTVGGMNISGFTMLNPGLVQEEDEEDVKEKPNIQKMNSDIEMKIETVEIKGTKKSNKTRIPTLYESMLVDWQSLPPASYPGAGPNTSIKVSLCAA